MDSLALGMHEPRVLWLLAGLGALAAVLALTEERLRAATFSLPLATPFAAVLVISGLTQPGVDAYRAGTPHLLQTLAVLALALAASAVALWRYPAARRADALVVAVVLVVEALALATVTLLTPHLGIDLGECAARRVGGPARNRTGAARRGDARAHVAGTAAQRAAGICAAGVLGLSAVLTVGNTAAFGATGGAIVVAGFWLAAPSRSRSRYAAARMTRCCSGAAVAAVGLCAFALVTTAPPHAFAYGAEHGWWALAAAAIAAVAAAFAALCAPVAYRSAVVVAASDGRALRRLRARRHGADSPFGSRLADAQLALSVVWAASGVALLGAGVFRAMQHRARPAPPAARSSGSRLGAHGRRHPAFGLTRGSLAVAAVWLAATAALALAVRRRADASVPAGSAVVAVATCAFALVVTAPPRGARLWRGERLVGAHRRRDRYCGRGRRRLVRPARLEDGRDRSGPPRGALRRLRPGRHGAHAQTPTTRRRSRSSRSRSSGRSGASRCSASASSAPRPWASSFAAAASHSRASRRPRC